VLFGKVSAGEVYLGKCIFGKVSAGISIFGKLLLGNVYFRNCLPEKGIWESIQHAFTRS
jgi:hypothetical protein